MATTKRQQTISDALRQALREAESIRSVARASGLDHASLVRFVNGERSLRLDLADKLAEYLDIVPMKRKRR